jgi:hypothetical protein
MPTLFQYAIFFLAALLCISLVLCVRESTDPRRPTRLLRSRPGIRPRGPDLPPAAPLQRIEARGLAAGPRAGEPAVPRALSLPRGRPFAGKRAPARPIFSPRGRPGRAGLFPAGPLSPIAEAPALPASLQRTAVPPAGDPSRVGPGHGRPAPAADGAPRQRAPDRAAVPPRPPGIPAGSVTPASAGRRGVRAAPPVRARAGGPAHLRCSARRRRQPPPLRRLRRSPPRRSCSGSARAPRPGGAPPRLALLSGGLQSEDIPGPARSDRDMALDQRNDTLWDLVVHPARLCRAAPRRAPRPARGGPPAPDRAGRGHRGGEGAPGRTGRGELERTDREPSRGPRDGGAPHRRAAHPVPLTQPRAGRVTRPASCPPRGEPAHPRAVRERRPPFLHASRASDL